MSTQVSPPALRPALQQLAEQAKALSHPARLAIIEILAAHDACICGEIVDDLPLAQSTVSQHLKVLQQAGLIKGTVDGPRSCYCLNRDAVRALAERWSTFFADLPAPSSPDPCC